MLLYLTSKLTKLFLNSLLGPFNANTVMKLWRTSWYFSLTPTSITPISSATSGRSATIASSSFRPPESFGLTKRFAQTSKWRKNNFPMEEKKKKRWTISSLRTQMGGCIYSSFLEHIYISKSSVYLTVLLLTCLSCFIYVTASCLSAFELWQCIFFFPLQVFMFLWNLIFKAVYIEISLIPCKMKFCYIIELNFPGLKIWGSTKILWK